MYIYIYIERERDWVELREHNWQIMNITRLNIHNIYTKWNGIKQWDSFNVNTTVPQLWVENLKAVKVSCPDLSASLYRFVLFVSMEIYNHNICLYNTMLISQIGNDSTLACAGVS